MYIIGITGGTGAGKTSVLKALQELGAHALDCDAVYHELLLSNADMKADIAAQFPDVFINGEISRKKLGEIVWSNPDSLQKLNDITHKFMDREIDNRIDSLKAQGADIIAIDAIALIESGQDKKCDFVVGIVAPQKKRLARIMHRDNITEEQALKRICAQQPESFYRENCEFIIENTYETEAEFIRKCTEFLRSILYG